MLPIVDYSRLADEAESTRLREITHEIGFFYLTGHGLSEAELGRVRDVAERFFELPEEVKRSVEMTRSPHFRGYSRLGGELTNNEVDWREQIDLGVEQTAIPAAEGPQWLQGPNQWPAEFPEMREILLDYQAKLSAIGLGLLRRWAVSLGAPADTFDATFGTGSASFMKLVHYPPRPADDPGDQGVGAHKDPGVLTLLLLSPGSGGLQVETEDGDWLDAPPVDGAFVVNIGELLEVATGGYLRATRHRVLTPAGAPARISIPYFFGPDYDAAIPTIELPADLAARSRGVEQDPDNPIYATYGENVWKARQRAHPDVYAIWHGDRNRPGAGS